ncbi:peroxiredoxin [Litorivivens lipolytica]|uniref:thioredoxin-dependent peroxiredoxin n=1 Tax=Litorivivens lipolytica TaxID=1524264 RepID=A0A7W4Z5D8_9GAMM|nr:peroxiredoxin family protein [Litorivivens lipolytica]MBB3047389.1 peroxiredoxin [Litorivivens lipolytica]
MHSLKRYFVVPFLLACLLGAAHSLWHIATASPVDLAWYGAALALLPMLGFMIYLGASSQARTSETMPLQVGAAAVGALLSLAGDQPLLPMIYAWVVGLGGVLAYVFWYSRLGRSDNALLKAGQALPDFELEDADGNAIPSRKLLGRKLILLFYRGNWCPLCVAQVRELAERYRELAERGVDVALVSPQPHKQTRELAAKFDVPLQFFVDRDGRAARKLNILHEGGIAAGISGYGVDTVLPTVLMVDEQGTLLYADLTDNYRVRPEPEAFLSLLDKETANV